MTLFWDHVHFVGEVSEVIDFYRVYYICRLSFIGRSFGVSFIDINYETY